MKAASIIDIFFLRINSFGFLSCTVYIDVLYLRKLIKSQKPYIKRH